MNQYKFRAWNKNYKSMVGWEEIMNSFRVNEFFAPQDDFILMQWTGLKDKNGVEIYDGDFLEEGVYVRWCDKQGGFELWLADQHCSACNGDVFWQEVAENSGKYEAIGNIHENPELLEV